jgi:hypothetical protein
VACSGARGREDDWYDRWAASSASLVFEAQDEISPPDLKLEEYGEKGTCALIMLLCGCEAHEYDHNRW